MHEKYRFFSLYVVQKSPKFFLYEPKKLRKLQKKTLRQQDIIEFFECLISSLNIPAIRSLFIVDETISCECFKCKTMISETTEKIVVYSKAYDGEISFANLFQKWAIQFLSDVNHVVKGEKGEWTYQ